MTLWTVVAVTLLLLLAALHVYWGRGGVWPGHSPRDLAQKVVGSARSEVMPPPLACYAVATALLLVAAALGVTTLPVGSSGLLDDLARPVSVAGAGVFLLRGLLGYLLPRLTRTEQSFDQLNRRLYSPLCLGLGLSILLALPL